MICFCCENEISGASFQVEGKTLCQECHSKNERLNRVGDEFSSRHPELPRHINIPKLPKDEIQKRLRERKR